MFGFLERFAVPLGRNVIRRVPVMIREVERPIVSLAERTGLWETVRPAVSFAGKWIGKPLAAGAGLLGFAHLGSIGVKEIREAFGIETETQKAEKMVELQRKQLENAAKEMELYKQYLNMLRSQQQPGYQPYSMTLPYQPEWMLGDFSQGIPKNEGKGGFDFSWLILLAGMGVIAYGLLKK